MKLQEFAQVVRSKNAGPRRFTLDVIFRDDADYRRAAQSGAFTSEKIAPLYGVAASAVTVINYPLGRAIKIVDEVRMEHVRREHRNPDRDHIEHLGRPPRERAPPSDRSTCPDCAICS
jgi:hypothetical protein